MTTITDITGMTLGIEASDFPAFWADCVNQGRIDDLISLYHRHAVLMPTFSSHIASNEEAVRRYFVALAARERLEVRLDDRPLGCVLIAESCYVVNGIYDFTFSVDGTLLTFPSRFTFVIDLGRERPILHHHSSQIPRSLS